MREQLYYKPHFGPEETDEQIHYETNRVKNQKQFINHSLKNQIELKNAIKINKCMEERFGEQQSLETQKTVQADEENKLKNKHIKQQLTQINISSGVVGMGSMKNDNGWKEMQSRIAEAHPASNFAQQHGTRTAKEIKTQAVVKKHQKRQAEQRKKYGK